MSEIELLMPEMGESVTDATIGNWLVAEGDTITIDQDVLEVSTDKVDTEIPSPVSGVLKKILHYEGDVVEVGKPLAIIEIMGNAEIKASPAVHQVMEHNVEEKAITEDQLKHPVPPFVPEKNGTEIAASNSGERFYSPLVRNIAKEEGISEAELEQIKGTGLEGRVTKDDMINYLSNRSSIDVPVQNQNAKTDTSYSPIQQQAIAQSSPISDRIKAPTANIKEGDELVEMDKMRKLIANHMVMSKQVSPHVTLFLEADVTNLWIWRKKVKDKFYEKEGQNLTFTPLFIEVVAKAIRAFPGVNVSILEDTKILYKKEINIGMATALPSGNLIVPVVKRTTDKTLTAIAKDVNDLANRARNNKLKPDDTTEGTFTITNIGTFDGLMGTPIINQPQAAILAVGAIKKKPVVLETPQGDVIGIRHMMYLSLGMDHRVIDGALGGAFLQKIKAELEDWDINREI